MEQNVKTTLSINPFASLKDFNYGIILIGIYYLFEFGSFQGLYPVINDFKLPFVLSILIIIHALYLILTKKVNFSGKTTKSFIFLSIFIIAYSYFSTRIPEIKSDVIKLFIVYLSQYIIVITCVKKPSQFILLIDIWLLSILFSSYHGIIQGGLVWGNRWLNDENQIALVTATAIPFAFILFRLFESKQKKLFYIICMCFYIAVNVVAASRGGALAMFIVIFLCLILFKHKMRNLIFIGIAALLVVNYAPQKYFNEMRTLEQGTEEATASDRIYLWKIAFEMFEDNKLIGVGPMNYPVYFSSYEKGIKYSLGSARVAHSTPLEWLAETGIVGCIILFLLQISLYKNWIYIQVLKNKSNTFTNEEEDTTALVNITHASAISQIGFWFAALFLTVMSYPFYWCLIAFSEAWKNITVEYINSKNT